MSKFKGITEKKMKDGSISIMVRFKYLGVTYPVKNFTKLYGCRTKSTAYRKLEEIRVSLSKNINPFKTSFETFSEIYEDILNTNEANKDWAYYTVKNRRNFFNRYIKNNKDIGRKKVENITFEDVESLLKQFNNSQGSSINTAIDILRPVFKDALEKGLITNNIMASSKFKKKRYTTRKEIEARVKTDAVDIVRSLYEAVHLYGREEALYRNIEIHQNFLYMLLLTAHRSGEIIQLRKEHCDLKRKKIYAPAEITKTTDYQFPIPDECYEYIKNHQGGLLFPIPKGGTVHRIFRRLVDLAEVERIENENISGHDTRRLLMTIMVEKLGIDSNIADFCLEHKVQGIKAHYLHLKYETKEKAFKKYWHFIRSGEIVEENQKAETNDSIENFERLEKLVSMFEKGLISKEQFESQRDKLLN